MTQISVNDGGVGSESFRSAVAAHLDTMSGTGWELVSTEVLASTGLLSNKTGVEALFFWKKY